MKFPLSHHHRGQNKTRPLTNPSYTPRWIQQKCSHTDAHLSLRPLIVPPAWQEALKVCCYRYHSSCVSIWVCPFSSARHLFCSLWQYKQHYSALQLLSPQLYVNSLRGARAYASVWFLPLSRETRGTRSTFDLLWLGFCFFFKLVHVDKSNISITAKSSFFKVNALE